MAPGPDQHPIDVAAVQRHRVHLQGLLGAVAPDRDIDRGLLHRPLHLAEAIDHFAVDGEQQIARLEQRRGGRPGHQPVDAEHLAALRVVLLESPHPLVGQSQLARAQPATAR